MPDYMGDYLPDLIEALHAWGKAVYELDEASISVEELLSLFINNSLLSIDKENDKNKT